MFQASLNVCDSPPVETALLFGVSTCSELMSEVSWNPHPTPGGFGTVAGVCSGKGSQPRWARGAVQLLRGGGERGGPPLTVCLGRDCHVCLPNELTNAKKQPHKNDELRNLEKMCHNTTMDVDEETEATKAAGEKGAEDHVAGRTEARSRG